MQAAHFSDALAVSFYESSKVKPILSNQYQLKHAVGAGFYVGFPMPPQSCQAFSKERDEMIRTVRNVLFLGLTSLFSVAFSPVF
jgi:hypothetical protein